MPSLTSTGMAGIRLFWKLSATERHGSSIAVLETPGSVHDARVYRRSELPTLLTPQNFSLDSHSLGDGAYPLPQSLLVLYRNNSRLTAKQTTYNTKHATTRVAIERAFGLLKGLFRRLRYVEACRPDNIATTIVVACVLHYACMEWQDVYDRPLFTENT
ncbi:unnamed protein product, partial [Ixodes persulcatus]